MVRAIFICRHYFERKGYRSNVNDNEDLDVLVWPGPNIAVLGVKVRRNSSVCRDGRWILQRAVGYRAPRISRFICVVRNPIQSRSAKSMYMYVSVTLQEENLMTPRVARHAHGSQDRIAMAKWWNRSLVLLKKSWTRGDVGEVSFCIVLVDIYSSLEKNPVLKFQILAVGMKTCLVSFV